MVYCNGPLCNKKWFPSAEALARHMWDSPKHSRCKACKRGFVDVNAMRNHRAAAHGWQGNAYRSTSMYEVVTQGYIPPELDLRDSAVSVESPSTEAGRPSDSTGFTKHSDKKDSIQCSQGAYQDRISSNEDACCLSCERRFESFAELQIHYTRSALHPTCKECEKGFKDGASLAEHRLAVHISISGQSTKQETGESSAADEDGVSKSREAESPREGDRSSQEGTEIPRAMLDRGNGSPVSSSADLDSIRINITYPSAGGEDENKGIGYESTLELPDSNNAACQTVSASASSRPPAFIVTSEEDTCTKSFVFPADASTIRPLPLLKIYEDEGKITDLSDSPTSVEALSSPPSSFTASLSPLSERADDDDQPVLEEGADSESITTTSSNELTRGANFPPATVISSGCPTPIAEAVLPMVVTVQKGVPQNPTLKASQESHSECDASSYQEASCQTLAYPSLRCRICHLDPPRIMTATMCGHLFCNSCIVGKIVAKPECPSCKAPTLLYCLFKLDLDR